MNNQNHEFVGRSTIYVWRATLGRGATMPMMRIREKLFRLIQRSLLCCAVVSAMTMQFAPLARAQPEDCEAEECEAEECGDEPSSYGPNACKPRGTLFQWSYGTSFSGGPPGPDEPLVSDRPDFTEASTTVGRGVLQIESGYTFIQDESGGAQVRTQSFPETLFRYGVFADWLELRLSWNYGIEDAAAPIGPTSRLAGATDLYLGVKIGLTPQEGILPEMALLPQLLAPTGGSAFTNGETLPGLGWLYSWEFNDFLSLSGSSQINRRRDGGTRDEYLEYAQSFSFGYSLSDKLGAYTEWFALMPSGADTEAPTHFADGGFTYQFTNNFQVDIRAGVGLNEAAENLFTGAGFVLRMP